VKFIPINVPIIGDEEVRNVMNVLRSGRLTSRGGAGYYVVQFERSFAKYVGVKNAVAVCSGTAALHATLLALNMRPGDEVLIPSFAFVAVAEAVMMAGGTPVFVDVDLDTYCMSVDSFEEGISRKTRAVIPVHLYGLTCDMDPISKIAREEDLVVIEDAAQAHGAEYKGRKAGSLGDLACFSFYATKNLTTGEGGMVTTNDRAMARVLRAIRNHGELTSYRSKYLGHNYRMNEIEAAIGLSQLSKLPMFLEARRANAEILTDKLKDLENLQLPSELSGRKHGWYVYTMRLKKAKSVRRNKVVGKLRSRGIEAVVYYPIPIHRMPYYRSKIRIGKGVLRNSEKLSQQVFSVPIHPRLKRRELDFVASTVRSVLRR
jgi:dTDP-4-amino-4,6-dideoxygalactose transaminase